MTILEKKIIEAYSEGFEKLSPAGKKALLKKLTASLEADVKRREDSFFKSFGAFGSDKSAEEIIKDIKGSRRFREKTGSSCNSGLSRRNQNL